MAKQPRVIDQLDRIRAVAAVDFRARVVSRNNFSKWRRALLVPASGFAALTVAGARALELELGATRLSGLARMGSGSASRSLFGGFVEWERGTDDLTSVAHELYPAEHWTLYDLVAVVEQRRKSGEQCRRTSTRWR